MSELTVHKDRSRSTSVEETVVVELAARTGLPVELVSRVRRIVTGAATWSHVEDYMSDLRRFEAADFEDQP